MLTAADVTKLKCNFIFLLKEYFKCRKYCLSCSKDALLQAFVDFKLSESLECPLDVYTDCRLSDIKAKTTAITCNSANFICSKQASVALSFTRSMDKYATRLINPLDGSRFAYCIPEDGVYQKAKIDIITTAADGSTYNYGTLQSGSYLSSGSNLPITTTNMYGAVRFPLSSIIPMNNFSFLIEIRFQVTQANGSVYIGPNFIEPVDIRVDSTSPYLGIAPNNVPANVLYTAHPSYATNVTKILKNALTTLYGAQVATNVDPKVSLYDGNLTVTTNVYNNPTGRHIGFKINLAKPYMVYRKGTPSGGALIAD